MSQEKYLNHDLSHLNSQLDESRYFGILSSYNKGHNRDIYKRKDTISGCPISRLPCGQLKRCVYQKLPHLGTSLCFQIITILKSRNRLHLISPYSLRYIRPVLFAKVNDLNPALNEGRYYYTRIHKVLKKQNKPKLPDSPQPLSHSGKVSPHQGSLDSICRIFYMNSMKNRLPFYKQNSTLTLMKSPKNRIDPLFNREVFQMPCYCKKVYISTINRSIQIMKNKDE